MITKKLPTSAQRIANHYLNLNLGGKTVAAPYFINENPHRYSNKSYPDPTLKYRKKLTKKRALIGKGNPEELEKAVYKIAKQQNFDLNKATTVQIRKFMMLYGLGIDCSAFVVWVLNEIPKTKLRKPIWKYIHFSGLKRRLIAKIRPVENISVKVLDENSKEINLDQIQPSDIIITWKGTHVLLISRVIYNKRGEPYLLEYINSTWWFGANNGVIAGTVEIKDLSKSLFDQKWSNKFKGKNWTKEGAKESRIKRLKIF